MSGQVHSKQDVVNSSPGAPWRAGFTLIELIIVIVIVASLATIGFVQYQRMIERARGSEARRVLGGIRTNAAAYWIARSDVVANTVPTGTFVPSNLGMGSDLGEIPTACAAGPGSSLSYYFAYTIQQSATNDGFTATATRCTQGGKSPTGPADSLTMTTDFVSGTDTWSGTY